MPYTKRIRVLLIDDEQDEYLIVKKVSEQTEALDLDIDWVETYDEGLERIMEAVHDVYLIDYDLQTRSGIELLEELQNRDKGNSIYILLTGQGKFDGDRDALLKGADDYISKDELNPNVLSRSIVYGLERRRNYLELEKKQNQYQQLYQNAKTPVIEVDLKMNVLSVNSAFKLNFGFPEDYEVGKSEAKLKVWRMLDCEEHAEKVSEHIQSKRAKGSDVFTCRNQQGDELLVQLDSYELIDAYGVTSYQIVIKDLTEKIRNDEAKSKQEKLDLMEKMARIVAHEVRNPLTNIILASEQLSPVLPADKLLYADMIRRNSDRIETLIRKFLDTFKSTSIVKVKQPINEVVNSCIEALLDKATLMGVKIENQIDSDLPEIPIDREKIVLVFSNIINNAIQACEESENGKIEISGLAVEGHLEVEFTDNGHGIPEEDMLHLFEPFFTKKTSGLGLGLTTSMNILQNHGGAIKVRNNSYGGASFTISLPYYLAE